MACIQIGVVHKRRPQSRVCPMRTRGGSSDADIHPFCTKIFVDFSKFTVYPHGQGGLSQCEHFVEKVGQFFRDTVRTSFMDGPIKFLQKIIFRPCERMRAKTKHLIRFYS